MNFYCNSEGSIIHVDPERVYQGSANAHEVNFVGAFPESAQVIVYYTLPNGKTTAPQLMTYNTKLSSVFDESGTMYNVWSIRLGARWSSDLKKFVPDYIVTENYGSVKIKFEVVLTDGNGIAETLAVSETWFEITKATTYVSPANFDGYRATLNQILATLQTIVAGGGGGSGSGGIGPPGEDGKSAYEIWLDHGGSGSEQDFLNSLKGANGANGQPGETGKSAYQTWLDLGNVGTEEDFINYLKADVDDSNYAKLKVTNAFSAYQTFSGAMLNPNTAEVKNTVVIGKTVYVLGEKTNGIWSGYTLVNEGQLNMQSPRLGTSVVINAKSSPPNISVKDPTNGDRTIYFPPKKGTLATEESVAEKLKELPTGGGGGNGIPIYDHRFILNSKTYHVYSLSSENMRTVDFSGSTGLWAHAGKIIGVSCYPHGSPVFGACPFGMALHIYEPVEAGVITAVAIDVEDTNIPYTIIDLATGEETEM